MPNRTHTSVVREIPLIDVGERMGIASAIGAPDRLENLVRSAYRRYTLAGVHIGDIISSRWLSRTTNPYAAELAEIASVAGRRGAHLLNMSYEWACTSGATADPIRGGNTLIRVLDWTFDGLGENLIAAKAAGPAGSYVSFTWPGYIGVLTAMAPGRFSASINQPPMLPTGFGPPGDWLAGRHKILCSKALPPAHLLRRVFDRCGSFADARKMLETHEVCHPAIFTLSGVDDGEECVIERLPADFRTRSAPAAVANHWVEFPLKGKPRGHDSHGRLEDMACILDQPLCWDMSWLKEPILNADTRVVAMMNAHSGTALVQGYEGVVAVTERAEFVLSAGQGIVKS
jgi:hypothetical protein